MFNARDPLTEVGAPTASLDEALVRDPPSVRGIPVMRREDLAAIRWIEVTIRRAGHRTVERYIRYAQHEQPNDPMDTSAVGMRVDEFPDLDDILDLQRAFSALSQDEKKVLWLSVVEDMPQVRIASELHLSQPRVSQVRRQALHRIRDLLGEKKGSQ